MSKAGNVYEKVQGKIDKLASELSDFRYDMENFQSECDAARDAFTKKTSEKQLFKALAKIIKTTNKNAEREQKIIKLMAKLPLLMTNEVNEES